ncbi:hypothetical protein SteCoe_30260 [Stentor coeruleus]|uniref:RING-type E3 ubiquitin transferase n=1 Tax=Stentor coeruleus TaxID=5963 RepID=A0A1R2B3Z4_9CILI|nr:hypothetical protein SteCoe_30260 [Stentor coeruleus]
MIRHRKLTCSVSEEISYMIEQGLLNKGIPSQEAFILSRKFSNFKIAFAESSLQKVLSKPKVEVEKVPISNKYQNLPPNKQEILNSLIEIGLDDDSIALLVEICESADEALANVIDIPGKGAFKNFSNKKKEDDGVYNYNKENNDCEKCSICYEFYQKNEKIKTLPCFHNFHMSCVNDWFTKGKKNCPMCMSKVK